MNTTLSIRIKVRGWLSQRLAVAFDGMTLVRRAGATELVGEVADQAQVHGLLSQIRDLGLELESVTVCASTPSRWTRGHDTGTGMEAIDLQHGTADQDLEWQIPARARGDSR